MYVYRYPLFAKTSMNWLIARHCLCVNGKRRHPFLSFSQGETPFQMEVGTWLISYSDFPTCWESSLTCCHPIKNVLICLHNMLEMNSTFLLLSLLSIKSVIYHTIGGGELILQVLFLSACFRYWDGAHRLKMLEFQHIWSASWGRAVWIVWSPSFQPQWFHGGKANEGS